MNRIRILIVIVIIKKRRVKDLGSGAGIVNTGGDEHATVTVDDESTMIVGDVERFEPRSFCSCYYNWSYENTHTKPCEYHCSSSYCSCFGIGIILQRYLHFCELNWSLEKLVMIFFLFLFLYWIASIYISN